MSTRQVSIGNTTRCTTTVEGLEGEGWGGATLLDTKVHDDCALVLSSQFRIYTQAIQIH